MKIEPIDITTLEQERNPWNPDYIASVLSNLLSKQRGYHLEIKLIPQDPERLG